ncbi:hypothetical protein EIN_327440 [Entamoeba invadens IP1]|uniref:Uncharacterized protein n=1 Tax=Entamoeba invadens IP1 TaxID=370355 RepID=A0A0A1TXI9_ENTIV|nr:hypothetical protein EIN_327440 [Entamoeba invadens IP1]ELP86097.1 hypothetical protein EIN_327440 [Entamoeba invadens IP1]|eukprot:XP_004185443.1 hypothetical protein EIN_327440 [Entamoeba invadens IP1]
MVLFFILLLTIVHAQDDYCDFNCFIEGLSFTVDMEGKMSTMGYNIPNITFNGMEVNTISGSVDDPAKPSKFTAHVSLHTLYGKGPIVKESKNKEIGYMSLSLKDCSLTFTLGFETYNYMGYNLVKGVIPSISIDLNVWSAKIDLKCTDCSVGDSIVLGLGDFFIAIVKNFLQLIVNSNIDKINNLLKTQLDAFFINVNTNYIEKYINNTHPLDIPFTLKENELVNITKNSMFDMLSWATTELLGGNTSLGINNLINRFTKETGSLVAGGKEEDTFPLLTDKIISALNMSGLYIPDINGTIDFALTFLNVSGLNTWNNLNFFEPLRDVQVNISNAANETSSGSSNSSESVENVSEGNMCSEEKKCDYQMKLASGLQDLEISMTFSINATAESPSVSTGGKKLHEEANFYLKVSKNYMEGRLQVAMQQGKFNNYSNSMCMNGNCWLALLEEGTGVPIFIFNTSLDVIKLTAASAYLEDGIQQIINSIVEVFLYNYKEAIPALINGLVNELATNYTNQEIEKVVGTDCKTIEDEIVLGYKPSVVVLCLIVACVLSAMFCGIALMVLVKKRRSQHSAEVKMKTEKVQAELNTVAQESYTDSFSTDTSEDKVDLIKHKTKKSIWKKMLHFPGWFFSQFSRTDPEGSSLFLDSRITILVRVIVPIIIFFNIGIFITSNTGIGATVHAYILFGGNNEIQMPVSTFGLVDSVRDMWTAGVYPLSILILVFSGIWPYTKLIFLLFSWFTPASILKPSIRGGILSVLDALGKWSFLDSYVMTLMIMAFYFDVPLPIHHPENVSEHISIQLYVDPEYGFTTLLLGTLVSLVLSHFMVFIHNQMMSHPYDNYGSKAKLYRPLMMYTTFFATRIVMILMILGSIGLIVTGFFINSFSFDFYGLAGWALDLLDFSQHRDFSVMDLGVDLPSACREPNSFVVRFIQVTYFITIVALPMVHLIVMLLLWIFPFNRKFQNWVFNTCEILYAWSCIDVFIISVIAAVVELSQFAEFMVEPMCGAPIGKSDMSLDGIIAKFFGEEKYIEGHETCFEVKAVLTDGCWYLFAGVVLYTITAIAITKISKRVLKERLPSQDEVEEFKENSKEKMQDKMPLLYGVDEDKL